MKRTMLGLLAALLSLMLCVGACAEGLDYSVAEKLLKQLNVGSGFEGVLTLVSTAVEGRASEAFTTIKPITVNCSYIYAPADAVQKTAEQRRLSLALMDGETAQTNAEIAVIDGVPYLQCDLLGDTWYSLNSDAVSTGNAIGSIGQSAFSSLAMPSLAAFASPLLAKLAASSSVKLDDALTNYTTKLDLWIEGYRQNAVLSKLDDGTTTLRVDYDVPPTAVKAQLKQIVYDLLNDAALLTSLSTLMNEDDAALYLNPGLQAYYFYAIDQLALTDHLTISRTISLKGSTLALHMSLPLYDKDGGAITVAYDRTAGDGDLPDENVVSLLSEQLRMRLSYQEYKSLTGVTVYQGSFLREPLGLANYEVGSEVAAERSKTISFGFSLKTASTSGKNEDSQDTLTYNVELSLTPDYTPDDNADEYVAATETQAQQYFVFTPLDLKLDATFASGQAKNAATSIVASFTVSGDELPEIATLTLTGKTKGRWSPSSFDRYSAVSLVSMSQETLDALVAQLGVKAGLLLLPSVSLPTRTDAPADAPEATLLPTVSPAPES